MSAAKTMLEAGSRSVQEIGEAVGYVDAAFFRGLFKRHTGMTPVEYRSRFCSSGLRLSDGAGTGSDDISVA
jgi:YesN/AraC family two-component response regulator